MSTTYTPYMSNECKLIKRSKIELRPVACPVCKPNENYIEPDIFSVGEEAYYNERTCEYTIVFQSDLTLSQISKLVGPDKKYKNFEEYALKGHFRRNPITNEPVQPEGDFGAMVPAGGTLEKRKIRILHHGLKQIAKFYNKKLSDENICAFPGCPDFSEVEKYKDLIADLREFIGINNVEEWGKKVGWPVKDGLVGLDGSGNAVMGVMALVSFCMTSQEVKTIGREGGEWTFELAEMKKKLRELLGDKVWRKMQKMLEERGSIFNEYALEWNTRAYALPAVEDIPIKIKISVGKRWVDALPDYVGKSADEEAEAVSGAKANEILEIKAWDFIARVFRVRHVIKDIFANHYDYYFAIDQGYIHYASDIKSIIYPSYIRGTLYQNFINLAEAIEEEINDCGYKLQKMISPESFDFFKTKITHIQLGFDTSDEENPFILKWIAVKPVGCDFKKIAMTSEFLTKSKEEATELGAVQKSRSLLGVRPFSTYLESFNKTKKNQINPMAYIVNILDLDDDVQAPDPAPWTEILQKYTYPLIDFSDKDALEEISDPLEGCGATGEFDLTKMFDNSVDFVEDLFELLAHQLNQQACRNNTADERRKTDKFNEKLGLFKIYAPDDADVKEEQDPLVKEYEERGGGVTEMTKMSWERALEEFNKDDTLILLLIDRMGGNKAITKSASKNPAKLKSKAMKILGAITMCDMTKMGQKVLKCMLAGIPFNEAMKKVVTALLKDLTLRQIPKLLSMLPAEKQMEVGQKVESIIKNMPFPGDSNYKSGGLTQTQMSEYDLSYGLTSNRRAALQIGQKEAGHRAAQKAHIAAQEKAEVRYKKSIAAKNENRNKSTIEEFDKAAMAYGDTIDDAETQNVAADAAGEKLYKQEQGSIGKATAEITELILQAYIDAILDSIGVQALLKHLNRFPVSKFLMTLVKAWLGYCPKKPWFNPSPYNFLKSFTFSVCDPSIGLKAPLMPKIKVGGILEFFGKKVKELFIGMLIQFLIKLIVKMILLVETQLCKALELMGRLAMSPFTGEGLNDIFRNLLKDFLCEEGDDDDVDDFINNIMKSVGATPEAFAESGVDPRELSACVSLTISSLLTEREMLELMSGREKDSVLLKKISDAIVAKCPALAPFFGDPDQIGAFFDVLRSVIPPETCLGIRDILDDVGSDVQPSNASICIPDDKYDEWNRLREDILGDLGVDPDEAGRIIDDLNQSALDNLQDILDAAAGNLGDMMAQKVAELLDDDPCSVDPNELGSSIIPNSNSSAEVKESFDNITDYILGAIHTSYTEELTDWNGLLNKIMSDTYGHSRWTHGFFRKFFMTSFFYYDSPEQAVVLEDESTFGGLAGMIPDIGFYPLTIGAHCRDSILKAEANYVTSNRISTCRMNATTKRGFGGGAYRYIKEGVYFINTYWEPSIILNYSSLLEQQHDNIYEINIKYHPAVTEDVITMKPIPRTEDGETLIQRAGEIEEAWEEENNDEFKWSSTEEGNLDKLLSKYMTATTQIVRNFDYQITTHERRVDGGSETKGDLSSIKVNSFVEESVKEYLSTLKIPALNSMAPKGTGELPYRVMVFNEFLNSKLDLLEGGAKFEGSELFDSIFNNFYQTQKAMLVCNPLVNLKDLIMLESGDVDELAALEDMTGIANQASEGFRYGNSLDTMSNSDMEYVGPDGEPYEYDEEDRVLGRAVDGPNAHRIFYLNPAIHGGYYTKPKIWLEPTTKSGWSNFGNIISPINQGCDPKDKNILNIEQIKGRVNHVKSKLTTDKRLFQEEYCTREIPFDRLLDKDTHGTMEGVIKATLRVYVTEKLMPALPMITQMHYNNQNYNNYFSKLVYEDIKEDMYYQGAWFSRIKRRAYFYLFLEQCVQAYNRKIQVDGHEPEGRVKEALENIKKVQIAFDSVTDEDVDYYQDKGEEGTFNLPGPKFLENLDTIETVQAYLDPDNEDNPYQLGEATANSQIFGGTSRRRRTRDEKKMIVLQHAMAWMAYGDMIFETDIEVEGLNVSFIDRFAESMLKFSHKLWTIRLVEEDCKIIFSELLNEEINNMMDLFNTKFPPAIFDIKEHFLSSPEIFGGSSLRMGTKKYRQELVTNKVGFPGDVMDIVEDPFTEHILDKAFPDGFDSSKVEKAGQFFIEKYIKFIERWDTSGVPEYIKDRDDLLKGKVSIETFKEFLQKGLDSEDLSEDSAFSDCFGDLAHTYAVPVILFVDSNKADPIRLGHFGFEYTPEQLELWEKRGEDVPEGQKSNIEKLKELLKGSKVTLIPSEIERFTPKNNGVPMTMQEYNAMLLEQGEAENSHMYILPDGVVGNLDVVYGMRISYMPPKNFSQDMMPTEEIIKKEKSYKFPEHQAGSVVIPLFETEYELIDEKLTNFLDEAKTLNNIDIDCLVTKMTQKPEFKLLFDNCISLKSINSIILAYIQNTFLKSIGENDGWSGADPNTTDGHFNYWHGRSFKHTKNKLRQIFASLYDNRKFQGPPTEGIDWGAFLKSLFSFNLSGPSFGWLSRWLSRQLVDEDPFDSNDEECGDEFLKLFK